MNSRNLPAVVAKLYLTLCDPWAAARQASYPSPFPRACSNSCPFDFGHSIQPYCHLLSLSSLAFNLSQHQVFSNELALHIKWPNYWSFSFSSSRSNEYSGLVSFRMDWFDLLADQGTLKSLPQHHSLKISILQH